MHRRCDCWCSLRCPDGREWRERQAHNKFRTVAQAVAACLDGSPVKLREALDQCESNAETAVRPTPHPLDLREHVEYPCDGLPGDADAIVLYRQH